MLKLALSVVGLVLFASVVEAQHRQNKPMPTNLSEQIDKHMIGEWNYEGSWGDKSFTGGERIRWTEDKTSVLAEGFELADGKKMSYVNVMGWSDEHGKLLHRGFTSAGDTWSGEWSEFTGAQWKGTGGGTYQGLPWSSPATLEFKKDWQRYEDVTDGKKWVAIYTRRPDAESAMAKLEEFIAVGSMTYQGETDAAWDGTEYGPAGKFSGNSITRSILGGNFLLEEWNEGYPDGGILSGISIHGYDAAKKEYFGTTFMSNGLKSLVEVELPDDQTMIQRFTQTSSTGEQSTVRAEWKYNDDKSEFDASWELSLDGGGSWKPWVVYHGVVGKK